MERRLNGITPDIFLFVLCTTVCVVSMFDISGVVFSANHYINLLPLSFIAISYIGYKFGRFPAVLAGAASFIIWMGFKIFLDIDFRDAFFKDSIELTEYKIIGNPPILASGQSIYSFFSLSLVGYMFGALFDFVDKKLSTVGLTLEDVIKSDSKFLIISGSQKVGRWVTQHNNDAKGELIVDIKGEKPSLKLKVVIKNIILYGVLALTVLISWGPLIEAEYERSYSIALNLAPSLAGFFLILVLGYYKGFKLITTFLLVAVFPLSILVAVAEFNPVGPSVFYPIFISPALVILAIISCWWIEKIRFALNDDEHGNIIKSLMLIETTTLDKNEYSNLSAGNITILLVFSVFGSFYVDYGVDLHGYDK